MRFLDWIKREKTPEREPEDVRPCAAYATRKGNEIELETSSRWGSDGVGVYELRHHVGRSAEGYHAGLEVSRQGGESRLTWSNARPNAQAADQTTQRMRDRWFDEMSPELERLENLQQANWHARMERKAAAKDRPLSPEH